MEPEAEDNNSWERKKQRIIRSLFQDVPNFSAIRETFYSSEKSSTSPRVYRSLSPRFNRSPSPYSSRPARSSYCHRNLRTPPQSPGRCSPLPPLIIEREPNRHDEPEEYYIRLEKKIKKIYRKLFLNEDISVSSVGDEFTMVDEDIDDNLNDNELNEQIAGDHLTMDDDAEVSVDRHSTIEDEEINADHSPNEHEVTVESDECTTIDEEVVDNDDLSDNESYTGDRANQNADHILQDDTKVNDIRQTTLNRQTIEVTDDRQSPREVTVDLDSLNRHDETMIDDHHYSEVNVVHHSMLQELTPDNLENIDMSLTLKNPDNESSTDVEDNSTTSLEDHESMSSVEDHVPGNPVSEGSEVSVNLEESRVSEAVHHTDDIEVMRTPRHEVPGSPHDANPSQSLENTLHFDHELSTDENRNIPELDKSNTFDILRLSENYTENAGVDFENSDEDLNRSTDFGNMSERDRAGNIGIPTVDRVKFNMNILNDNIFIGTPKVFNLCSCTNHYCGN